MLVYKAKGDIIMSEKTQAESQVAAQTALKSKKNFEEYVQANSSRVVDALLGSGIKDRVITIKAELTQSQEGLCALLHNTPINLDVSNHLFWFIVNEKEELVHSVKFLNSKFRKGFGIYLIKAVQNEDKIDFEILLQPEIIQKSGVKRNLEAPSKILQLKYWQKYFEICDALNSDLQIKPSPQHWQTISIGKTGISITPTINTKEKYVACELFIANDKKLFRSLFEHKKAIEKSLGKIDWQELDGKKSSRIRQKVEIDITNEANFEEAAKTQIQMAEAFKATFRPYLSN